MKHLLMKALTCPYALAPVHLGKTGTGNGSQWERKCSCYKTISACAVFFHLQTVQCCIGYAYRPLTHNVGQSECVSHA